VSARMVRLQFESAARRRFGGLERRLQVLDASNVEPQVWIVREKIESRGEFSFGLRRASGELQRQPPQFPCLSQLRIEFAGAARFLGGLGEPALIEQRASAPQTLVGRDLLLDLVRPQRAGQENQAGERECDYLLHGLSVLIGFKVIPQLVGEYNLTPVWG
jgi:hypothetical protein